MNQMKRAMDEALEAMHASPCLAERIVEAERSKKARGFRPLVVLAAALVVISVGVTAGSGRLWNVERTEADGLRITQEIDACPLSAEVRERLHGLFPHYMEQWLEEFNGLDRDAFATQEEYDAALRAIDQKWEPLLAQDTNVLPDALHYDTLRGLREDLGIGLLPFERLSAGDPARGVSVSLMELHDQPREFHVWGSFLLPLTDQNGSVKVIFDLYTVGGQQFDSRNHVEGTETKGYYVNALKTDAVLSVNESRQSVWADFMAGGIEYSVALLDVDDSVTMTERIERLTSLLETLG